MNVKRIRFWCNKVLPLVYDDSLSYYEVLCKVVAKINEIIDTDFGLSVADPIEWNITSQYPQNTIVVDSDGTAYISKQPVPTGVALDNEAYWLVIFNYGNAINDIRSNIAPNEGESDTALADREKNTLVWVQGVLYKTLRFINAGDRYIVNTNIEATTVSDMLNLKYDEIDESITFPNGRFDGIGTIQAGDRHVYNQMQRAIIIEK